MTLKRWMQVTFWVWMSSLVTVGVLYIAHGNADATTSAGRAQQIVAGIAMIGWLVPMFLGLVYVETY